MIDMSLQERASKIRLVIMDVDGVLTDGHIVYDRFGDELKFFDVQDGFGLSLLAKAGIKTALVTAKKSSIVKRRARDARITRVFMNAADKGRVYKRLLKKYKLQNENICSIGDDLFDIPMMRNAGLAVAVSGAAAEVKQLAHYVTQKPGGRGAAREIVEVILKSQGKWEEVVKPWVG